jgi:prepilin-type N-terminal cleavage/methylation domain-containing protein
MYKCLIKRFRYMKNKKQRKGFSLMEMIVATALFLAVTTVSIGIFLSVTRANTKISAMQKVENEIRYIVEMISKEVRLGTIYYDYYDIVYSGNFENPAPILALMDNADNISYFALNGGIVQMSLDGFDWSDLSTDSVVVDSLDFYLLPDSDPFSQDSTIIKQPMVTLFLEAHYNKGNSSDGQIRIQTTIGSRQYKK